MSKFNLRILLKIISGIIQVVVRVLSDSDYEPDIDDIDSNGVA